MCIKLEQNASPCIGKKVTSEVMTLHEVLMVEIGDSRVLHIPAYEEHLASVQEGRGQHLERVVGLDQTRRRGL